MVEGRSAIIFDRLKNAWNAFIGRRDIFENIGYSSSNNPTVPHFSYGIERTIITAIYNRIAIDVSAYDIKHVRLDTNTDRYLETINSGLNYCLTVEANKDQTGRSFIQDITMSLFNEGFVAIVPVDTNINPNVTNSYDILSVRTGKVKEWFPNHVRVDLYNDRTGQREELILPKSYVALIENPLYSIINEPNSVLKRLIRKLLLLDAVDEQTSSGKLDLIIQLPYVVKTELRQRQAEERRKAVEAQLMGSKYGIAYIDGTERVTQLNRPAENNLMAQIEYLTTMLYNQLGISSSVFDGTADDRTMQNYYDRTIEPIVLSITEEMRRKFLTKTARTQGQTIMGFRDIFNLIPANEIAIMADSLTRNEILTSNEVRAILGLKPSTDPAADELRNKNMPLPAESSDEQVGQNGSEQEEALSITKEILEQV